MSSSIARTAPARIMICGQRADRLIVGGGVDQVAVAVDADAERHTRIALPSVAPHSGPSERLGLGRPR